MVFTAAALAIGAVSLATAATAAATIATAVVAVSAAVGVVGLAVTAVGAITGNQDLMGIGEIMGYVGLAGGLAGGLIGGVGGMLEGGAGFLSGAKGAFVGAGEKLSEAGGKYSSFFDDVAGAKVMGAPEGPMNAVGANGVRADLPAINAAPKTNLTGLDPAINPASSVIKPPVAGAPVGTVAPTPVAPVSPTVAAPAAPVVNAPVTPVVESAVPDWMKYSAMTAGMQGLTGMAGGMFQGESAEQQMQLEREKLALNKNQQDFIQKNNSYAPRITFKGGLLQQPA